MKRSKLLLVVFCVWAVIGFVMVGLDLSVKDLEHWDVPEWLGKLVWVCMWYGDFVFILLAMLLVSVAAVERLGIDRTLLAFLMIVPGSWLLETYGTLTGYPFGAYDYTAHFGPRLWLVPLAVPMSWFTIVVGGYLIFRQWMMTESRWILALLTGGFAVLLDALMEPFACEVREFWIWADGRVPVQNYVSWFVAATLFARFSPIHARHRPGWDFRPLVVFGAMIITFLLGKI